MSLNKTEERLADYFRGVKRAEPESLADFKNYNWEELAKLELLKRATNLVQALDNQTLRNIAAGEADPIKIAEFVLSEPARK